ncbi:hypothetical protein KQI63_13075 [bacterium]|nr:hypothetical protein [bacterium]
MKIANVQTVRQGDVLGKGIYSEDGTLLIPSGFALTADQVAHLCDTGTVRVYLMDPSDRVPLPGNTLRDLARRVVQIQVSLTGDVPDPNKQVLKHCSLTTIQQQVEEHPAWRGATSRANPISFHQAKDRATIILDKVVEEYRPLFLAFPERMFGAVECSFAVDTAILSLIIGEEYQLPERELRLLATAALTHDLGYSLLAPLHEVPADQLSKDERMMLREHPAYTVMLLRGAYPGSDDEQAILLRHHERLDGSGYPLGTKSKGLPPDSIDLPMVLRLSEILAVTSLFMEKTSTRPGNEPVEPVTALTSFLEHSGTLFNHHVVRTLASLIQHFPIGSQVRIRSNSSGRYTGFCGVVKSLPKKESVLPVKKLLLTHNSKEALGSPLEVDFSSERHLLLEMLS